MCECQRESGRERGALLTSAPKYFSKVFVEERKTERTKRGERRDENFFLDI